MLQSKSNYCKFKKRTNNNVHCSSIVLGNITYFSYLCIKFWIISIKIVSLVFKFNAYLNIILIKFSIFASCLVYRRYKPRRGQLFRFSGCGFDHRDEFCYHIRPLGEKADCTSRSYQPIYNMQYHNKPVFQ